MSDAPLEVPARYRGAPLLEHNEFVMKWNDSTAVYQGGHMTTSVLHPNAEYWIGKFFIYSLENQQILSGISQ